MRIMINQGLCKVWKSKTILKARHGRRLDRSLGHGVESLGGNGMVNAPTGGGELGCGIRRMSLMVLLGATCL